MGTPHESTRVGSPPPRRHTGPGMGGAREFPAGNNTGLQEEARGQVRVMTAAIEPTITEEHLPSAAAWPPRPRPARLPSPGRVHSPASPRTRPTELQRVKSPELPSAGYADVRIAAGDPEAARRVAEMLRACFATIEARSHSAGADGGTRLQMVLGWGDTRRGLTVSAGADTRGRRTRRHCTSGSTTVRGELQK